MSRLASFLLALLVATFPPPGTTEAQEEDEVSKGLSLVPSRTIAFETTEGTYMNLDVSLDGTTIVFDLLGDIYRIAIEGGTAERLTSGMAYDVQPAFSPDGSEIVFVSDRSGSDNLWILPAGGGEPTAVTAEEEEPVVAPAWTSDGQYLVARRGRKLWLYHRDGGDGMELTAAKEAEGAMGPSVSGDDRFVYFSAPVGGAGTGRTPAAELARIIGWQVKRLDRLTGDVATVTVSPNGAFRPALSPDGKAVAYGARVDAKTGLRYRNLDTDEEKWLLYDIDRDNAERPGSLDLMPRYDFTPDGSAVIIATGGGFRRVNVASGAVTHIPFEARVEQQLGPFVYFENRYTQEPVRIRNIRSAHRSPSGQRLVFSAHNKIWTMELPAGRPRAIVAQPFGQFHPALSPDGQQLAFVSWDDADGGHLWVVAADGSGTPKRLTPHSGFYLRPSWSPDGTRVVFIKEDAAAFRNVWTRNSGQIHWVPAAGGDPDYVASAPSDNRPSFDAEGERVIYLSEVTPANRREEKPAHSVLSSVALDGTDKRTLAELEAEVYEAVVSPDGNWLAYTVREDVFVAALPRGGEVPLIKEDKGPGPVKRLSREGGIDVHWEGGGEALSWTFADTFYRTPFDAISNFIRAADEAASLQPETTEVRLEFPRSAPSGVVALRGGNVLSMATEEVLSNQTVVVTDNRITAIGPRAEVTIPDGARIVDVSGRTLLPGFIDLHAHLRPPREVFVENNWSYYANLAYGVTTTRDVSTSNDSFAYGELVETGAIVGPRIYSTGRALLEAHARIENLDDARAVVRHYKKMGTSVIKQYMQPHRRQRQWVIQAAREEGINVTNEGGGDFRLDMTMVLDGFTGVEHSLPIADIYSDVVRLFAESRTWYTPTLVVSYGGPTAEWYFYQTTNVHDDEKLRRFTPHEILDRRTRRGRLYAEDEFHFLAVSRVAAKILEAGGNVALGAHGEEQGICAHWELWALQMGGLSNYDALRTATSVAAEGLGLGNDLGRLEVGKLADILVLRENPLDDIRNTLSLELVMKNGELYDADTMDRLWPDEAKLPPLFYREYGPPRMPTTN